MKYFKSIYNKIRCRLGYHDWENIDNYTPKPKEGESVAFTNLHKCKRCGKEQYLGMGTIM